MPSYLFFSSTNFSFLNIMYKNKGFIFGSRYETKLDKKHMFLYTKQFQNMTFFHFTVHNELALTNTLLSVDVCV